MQKKFNILKNDKYFFSALDSHVKLDNLGSLEEKKREKEEKARHLI